MAGSGGSGSTSDRGVPESRPALTEDSIIRAALRIVDEAGLEGLSMRRLGRELGTTPMAMYAHISSKAALLDGVTRHLLEQAIESLSSMPSDLSWQETLIAGMKNLRLVLLHHVNAIVLVGTHPMVTGGEMRLVAGAVDMLADRGMPVEGSTMMLVNDLAVYTFGHVLAEAVPPAGGAGGTPDRDALLRAAGESSRMATFLRPLIEKSDAEGASGSGADAAERRFELGLHAMVAGWNDALRHVIGGA